MKEKVADFFSIYFHYSRNTIRIWFQYRLEAILRSFAVFFRESTNVIVIYFTLKTFGCINGWNSDEMFFLYSLLFLTYGILIVFFTGLRDFGYIINKGEFDRFMLRPRGLLFQVIASNSDWFAAIGHGGLGVILFVFSAGRVGIEWNIAAILYYLTCIISGVLVQGAIFLILASLSFYLIKTNNIKDITYNNAREFAGYPISIYPKVLQVFMIYIVPFAFVNYFPAQFFLRKSDMELFPYAYVYISPVIGIFFFILAYCVWKVSIRHYKSSGN